MESRSPVRGLSRASAVPDIVSVGARRDAEGTVYLLHFEQALRGARHYIGWTSNLDARIARHRRGGSTFTGRLVATGIGFRLARTWPGTPLLERELRRIGHKRLCPLCEGVPRA